MALVVDRAARVTEQAVRARAEANALAVLSHRLLHSGESQAQLLDQACEVFGMTGAAVLRGEPDGTVDGRGHQRRRRRARWPTPTPTVEVTPTSAWPSAVTPCRRPTGAC